MNATDLKALRMKLKLTQAEMSARMGLGLRAYTEVETGSGEVRPLHERAARWVAFIEAADQGDPMLADDQTRRAVKMIYETLFGERA